MGSCFRNNVGDVKGERGSKKTDDGDQDHKDHWGLQAMACDFYNYEKMKGHYKLSEEGIGHVLKLKRWRHEAPSCETHFEETNPTSGKFE